MAGLLLLVGGCTKARVGDDDASVAPNPLDETFLCHVFSNELLQKEIDFYTEYYAYYSSEPYSSSEWGDFKCYLQSARDVTESDTLVITVKYNAPSISDAAREAPNQKDSQALALEGHEGSGWTWYYGKNLVWEYPDGSSLHMWAETTGESGWMPEEGTRKGLVVVFDSLIDKVPGYMQVAGDVPFTRVPPDENG